MSENKLIFELTPRITDNLEIETMNLLIQIMERHQRNSEETEYATGETVNRIALWFFQKYGDIEE